jgi:hypothetical protein
MVILSNTNALNILTPHIVIASPKGVAISFFMGLLRRSAPRNDKLPTVFVLMKYRPSVDNQGLPGNEIAFVRRKK